MKKQYSTKLLTFILFCFFSFLGFFFLSTQVAAAADGCLEGGGDQVCATLSNQRVYTGERWVDVTEDHSQVFLYFDDDTVNPTIPNYLGNIRLRNDSENTVNVDVRYCINLIDQPTILPNTYWGSCGTFANIQLFANSLRIEGFSRNDLPLLSETYHAHVFTTLWVCQTGSGCSDYGPSWPAVEHQRQNNAGLQHLFHAYKIWETCSPSHPWDCPRETEGFYIEFLEGLNYVAVAEGSTTTQYLFDPSCHCADVPAYEGEATVHFAARLYNEEGGGTNFFIGVSVNYMPWSHCVINNNSNPTQTVLQGSCYLGQQSGSEVLVTARAYQGGKEAGRHIRYFIAGDPDWIPIVPPPTSSREDKVFCVDNDPDIRTDDPSSGKIATAIGCIPVTTNPAFAGFMLRWGIGMGGGIAFILIVSASFMMITSAGDPQKFKAGKELLVAAVSGLALLVFSVLLLRFMGHDVLVIPGFS